MKAYVLGLFVGGLICVLIGATSGSDIEIGFGVGTCWGVGSVVGVSVLERWLHDS